MFNGTNLNQGVFQSSSEEVDTQQKKKFWLFLDKDQPNFSFIACPITSNVL